MKVFLDDRRNPPDNSWTVVRTASEAIELLRSGRVSAISFDHDLGDFADDGTETTGYTVLQVLEREVVLNGLEPPIMSVHSSNPPGRARLEKGIDAIQRAAGKRALTADEGSA